MPVHVAERTLLFLKTIPLISIVSNNPAMVSPPKTLRIHLKKVHQGSGQGAGRRKSTAYTGVCEHFEPTRNAAMGP